MYFGTEIEECKCMGNCHQFPLNSNCMEKVSSMLFHLKNSISIWLMSNALIFICTDNFNIISIDIEFKSYEQLVRCSRSIHYWLSACWGSQNLGSSQLPINYGSHPSGLLVNRHSLAFNLDMATSTKSREANDPFPRCMIPKHCIATVLCVCALTLRQAAEIIFVDLGYF